MNISSMIVYSKLNNLDALIKDIQSIDECEVAASKDGKIVVVSQTKDTNDQIKVFKNLENLKGVDSVSMVYSYEEMDDDKISSQISKMLDDDSDIKDVKYSGDVNIFI